MVSGRSIDLIYASQSSVISLFDYAYIPLLLYLGYDLWAGGQPDFQYAAAGDSSDYMYASMGVASFGLELGEKFYEDCGHFEDVVLQDNINALFYAATVAKKPGK